MIDKAIQLLLTSALGFGVSPHRSEGKTIRASFSVVSTVRNLNVDGSANTAKSKRVQLDIWGPSYAAVKAKEKLAESLHGYQGTVDNTPISLIKVDETKPEWKPVEGQYRITIDLIIYYDE